MMNNRPQHSGRSGAAIRMPAAPAAPDAEHLLHDEFSYVLHMSLEETAAFVCRELGVQQS